MKTKPSGISTPTYNSILKDISQIYETAQSDGMRRRRSRILGAKGGKIGIKQVYIPIGKLVKEL